jgi:hypothetical protein
MTVDIEELRKVLVILLDVVESNGAAVEILDDFYWDVPGKHRYQVYEPPAELTVGQLTDDWSELRRIGCGEVDALPYALVWAASILRRIGEISCAPVRLSDHLNS